MLEGRHVIGFFMLMLLFSGVFFTLGYVMGRNQYDGQVRASTNLRGLPDSTVLPKPEVCAETFQQKICARTCSRQTRLRKFRLGVLPRGRFEQDR